MSEFIRTGLQLLPCAGSGFWERAGHEGDSVFLKTLLIYRAGAETSNTDAHVVKARACANDVKTTRPSLTPETRMASAFTLFTHKKAKIQLHKSRGPVN